MKHLPGMATVLPALALLAACGESNEITTTNDNNVVLNDELGNVAITNDGEMPANEMGNAASAEMGPMTAQQFADSAAASDQFEIESSRLAQSKATSQELKDFAAMMIKDHTNSTAKLKAAATDANVTPNPALNPEQQANLDTLRSASGAAFDTAYRSQQVAAHEKALAMLEGYAANGEAAPLKSFASSTAPIVRQHLERIRGMQEGTGQGAAGPH